MSASRPLFPRKQTLIGGNQNLALVNPSNKFVRELRK
jgi:hypothetical protein